MDQLGGKVAVITGGASGIGLATAEAFGRAGMKLVLADTNGEALEKAEKSLSQQGIEAIGVVADVGDRAAVERLAEMSWERFGRVHVLFNNAGVAVYGRIEEVTHADWEWSLRVNLWGAIHGVESFLPKLLAQGEEAHIVNCASFAGLVASRYMAPYNVAKAGVVALTESLHKDLRGTGIGVSVLCPMRIATNVWTTSPQNRPASLGGSDAFRHRPVEETSQMSGAVLEAGPVGDMVVEAIRKRRLYIHPHDEARPIFRRRFEKIDAAFDILGGGTDDRG